MTLLQIRYFVEAAKLRSYTKTAEIMFVSQQAVSKQMKALEQELGFSLFFLQKRHLELTSEGKQLLAVWEPMLKNMDRVLKSIKENRENSVRILRIGVLEYQYIKEIVFPILTEYGACYPNIQMDIVSGNPTRLKRLADDKKIDLLCTFSSELPEKYENAKRWMVKALNLSIILSKDHPLSYGKSLKIEDLAGETVFIFAPSHSEDAGRQILSRFKECGFMPKVKFFSSQESMEVELMMGKGITTGFRESFRDPFHRLKFYPLSYRKDSEPAYIAMAGISEMGAKAVGEMKESYQKNHKQKVVQV